MSTRDAIRRASPVPPSVVAWLVAGLLFAPALSRAQICDGVYVVGVCGTPPQNIGTCAWGPYWYTAYYASCATGQYLSIARGAYCSGPGCAGEQLGIINDSACTTGIQPAEICGNGIDDNYDGCVDEGCTIGTEPCTCAGACSAPPTTCQPQASRTKATCDPFKGSGSGEICGDGIDNDCNGRADENCSLSGPVTPSAPRDRSLRSPRRAPRAEAPAQAPIPSSSRPTAR